MPETARNLETGDAAMTKILDEVLAANAKYVGRPVVQNLRGSLGPHEVGIVVTSSGFSAEAREEAQDATKAPIALISGRQFAELLLKHQIGVQSIDRKLYRLALDDLAEEKLHARVEEFDEGDA
jgi:restriction system protein